MVMSRGRAILIRLDQLPDRARAQAFGQLSQAEKAAVLAELDSPEQQVRDAYRKAGGRRGEFVFLDDLRGHLRGMSRAGQDRVLTRMYVGGEVNLIPVNRAAALTAGQKAGGLRLGGEDKHRISIE